MLAESSFIQAAKLLFSIGWSYSKLYFFWIMVHYASSHAYIYFCTPKNIIGFLKSPFMVISPQCQGIDWVQINSRTIIKNITSAINLFKPAKYLPYHSDSYFRYKEVFNIKKDSIVRAVVMLEDWQPGQIILIDNKSYSGWKSGEYWCWKNDTKHSFYNMSIFDRYSLQITGTILE